MCCYTFRGPDERRPVLILTGGSVIPYLNEVTVASIASRIRNIPTEVRLGGADGMPEPCAVNFDHLQTVFKRDISPAITRLRLGPVAEARPALLCALEFEE